MSSGTESLPSCDLRVCLAHDVCFRDDTHVLAGGTPFRLLRLTDSGAEHICRWRGAKGDVVGDDLGARALARRLLDYGLLLSDGCESTGQGPQIAVDVDVVVPVHGRSDQLDLCLIALADIGANVVVVDDGSSNASAIAEVASRHGAGLIRLSANRGPAAARNAGLLATSRPFVAFVDSDVTVPRGSLERLLSHFADPLVAIATPRVLPADPDRSGWVAGYENSHSALDLGTTGGNAGPGRRVSYIISAAIVARRSAIGSGFVEELKSGEDVDLGWRVAAAGWRVLYDPGAIVRHDHRVHLIPLLRKRWAYGRSVGPLARRHPGSLAPLRASGLTIAALATAAGGRPVPAAGLLGGRAFRLSRYVQGDGRLAATMTGRDVWFTTLGVARAVRRAWAPAFLLAALRSRNARQVLILAFLLRFAEDDYLRLRDVPLSVLDDVVAALALWSSCAETRVLDPLLPRIHT